MRDVELAGFPACKCPRPLTNCCSTCFHGSVLQLLRKLFLDADEDTATAMEYSSPTHQRPPRNLGAQVAIKMGRPPEAIPVHGQIVIAQADGSPPPFNLSSPVTATASLHIGGSPPDPI